MVPFLAGRGLQFIIWGTLAASTFALKFNFTDVQQCEQIMMSFTGSNTTAKVPFALSVIPFNSTVITFPLPNPALVSSGVALTFLPFPAGLNFIASLDSVTGDSVIPVSDIIRILPSANNETNCLPTDTTTPPRRFKLASPVSQCEEFTVEYDTSVVSMAPTVRLYNPKGFSFPLKLISDNPASGSATYMMNFFRGTEIVLTMNGGAVVKESTPLLTIQGDVASPTSCLPQINTTSNANASGGYGQNPATPRAVVIGAAVGGTIVVLVGICMGLFVVRERRRRRRPKSFGFDPSQMEKAPRGSNGEDMPPSRPQRGAMIDPLYTYPDFISPTKPTYPRNTMSSWAQVTPDDQKYSVSSNSVSQATIRSTGSVDRLSLESLDIEGMLNMATIQTETRDTNSSSNIPDRPMSLPSQMLLRPQISEKYLRNPPDAPSDLRSTTFSGFSINPFDPSPPASIVGPIMDPQGRLTSGSGLPNFPQEVLKPSRGRNLSDGIRVSYGVAR